MKNGDFEDDRLLSCPFCGAKPFVRVRPRGTGHNTTGIMPEGAELDHVNKNQYGNIYYWRKSGFQIHCSTNGCICRNGTMKFATLEAGIRAWNKRSKK